MKMNPRYRIYWITWGWLFVLTILALGAGTVTMPYGIKATLLVVISCAKVALIAAFFMHLRMERLNLVMMTLTPLVLGIIMFFLFVPDTTNTALRTIALMP